VKVRCCKCGIMIDHEDGKVIEVKLTDKPVEYLICKKCHSEAVNLQAAEQKRIRKGGNWQ